MTLDSDDLEQFASALNTLTQLGNNGPVVERATVRYGDHEATVQYMENQGGWVVTELEAL